MLDSPLVAFTQRLVRQRSIHGEEGAVVELIAAEMKRLKFDRVWVDRNGSAVGVIDGAKSGPTILLDGHCDTVGVAPGAKWIHDPFGGEIEANSIYGRGASDMKGALAAMISAAAAVDRSVLAGRIAVSATVMEENLEGASLQTVMEAVHPGFVVMGEATNLNLNRGGRGRAEIQLETIGRPAHSSTPNLGRNAILDMMKVVEAVEHLPASADPLLGSSLFALTDIVSEPYPAYSVIPSRCRVTYDRRLLLGETPDSVVNMIRDLSGLDGITLDIRIVEGEHRTYTGAVLRGLKFFPAWILPENHPYVQTCLQALRKVGLRPELGAYRFCTNAAYSAGVAKVPTVGFGPGREEDAHVADERLSIDELELAERGYRAIIEAVLA